MRSQPSDLPTPSRPGVPAVRSGAEPPRVVDAEFVESEPRSGDVGQEEAERIAEVRRADEASIRSEPFVLGLGAFLVLGCLVPTAGAAAGIGDLAMVIPAAVACVAALGACAAVVLGRRQAGG